MGGRNFISKVMEGKQGECAMGHCAEGDRPDLLLGTAALLFRIYQRSGANAVTARVSAMTERRQDYAALIDHIDGLNRKRDEADIQRWGAFMAGLNELRDAFPGRDPAGHCRWHEAEIARVEERTALFRDIRASVLKWGAIALLGWLAISIWHAVLAAIPHKGA